MEEFYVYILRCNDGSYYTGHTDDIDKRISEHKQGLTGGYTFSRRPVYVAYVSEFPSRAEALDAERQIKGWTRAKKEALICENWEQLQILSKCTAKKT